MANAEHLTTFAEGIDHWNQWRLRHASVGNTLDTIDLSGAILVNQNLTGANLCSVDLTDADLNGANLTGADLSDAILVNVDLSTTKGLLPNSLAGADLTRAKLPDSLAKFEGMERIDELSKNTGALFISMMAACAYSWLTIGSTKDVELVLNSGASALPIIQTEIQIVGFYYIAPFVLLGIFFYLHLYLQRLWEAMSRLPAVFPDGITVDKKTYSWLLNDLICAYSKRLEDRREPLFWLQKQLSVFLAFWLVPLTLWLFWARYIVRHEWVGTWLQIAVLSVGVGSALTFYHLARITMRKDRKALIEWVQPFQHPGQIVFQGTVVCAVGFSLWYISQVAMENPALVSWKYLRAYASLERIDISQKPETWTGADDQYQFVRGAQMTHLDLVGANLTVAFAAKANLSGTNLRDANLRGANLRGAELMMAGLYNANLHRANLRGADLSMANLRYANLVDANLTQSDLRLALLRGANLFSANLRGADLREANLPEAKLNHADLTGADLSSANLRNVDLFGANLSGANLRDADLRGADLSVASGLLAGKVKEARLDTNTKLPFDIQVSLTHSAANKKK